MFRRLLGPIVILAIVLVGVVYSWNKLPWLRDSTEKETEIVEVIVPEPEAPKTYATAPEVDYLAPDFALPRIGNGDERLSQFVGRPIILTFWRTDCPFCVSQLATFNITALLSSKPVVVLAVNRGQPIEAVVNWRQSREPFPAVRLFVDTNEEVSNLYKATELPVTFFIDATGVIRSRFTGELAFDQVREALGQLTAEP
ncbi:MAG: TlpA disulfide reductase family protein [Patescibacteria group bacterium]|jgi:peroxiredoxin